MDIEEDKQDLDDIDNRNQLTILKNILINFNFCLYFYILEPYYQID
jgi:hypothetical protein